MLFSSRLSAIARMKQRAEVDPAAVMQFLIHTVVPAPLTIYKGIERLEPGTLSGVRKTADSKDAILGLEL